MIASKMNSDSITWKNTCLAKQRVLFVNQNEKHISHDTSERAEGETKERRKKLGALYSHLCAVLPKFFMWNHVTQYVDLWAE